jgi:hypothetical protein
MSNKRLGSRNNLKRTVKISKILNLLKKRIKSLKVMKFSEKEGMELKNES